MFFQRKNLLAVKTSVEVFLEIFVFKSIVLVVCGGKDAKCEAFKRGLTQGLCLKRVQSILY